MFEEKLRIEDLKKSDMVLGPPNGQASFAVEGEVTLFGRFSDKQPLTAAMPLVISDIGQHHDILIGIPLITAYAIGNLANDGKTFFVSFPMFDILHEIDAKTRTIVVKNVLEHVKGRDIQCTTCQKHEEHTSREQLFKCCARCNLTFYCSRACQILDWTKHRNICKGYEGYKVLKASLGNDETMNLWPEGFPPEMISKFNKRHKQEELLGQRASIESYPPGIQVEHVELPEQPIGDVPPLVLNESRKPTGEDDMMDTGLDQSQLISSIRPVGPNPTVGESGGHASEASTKGPMIMPTKSQLVEKLHDAALSNEEKLIVVELLHKYRDRLYCEGELPPLIGVNFQVKYQGPHNKQDHHTT